ncbi:MAG: hypothetical protein ACP5PM_08085 [Acidimicrobiales bacterium]
MVRRPLWLGAGIALGVGGTLWAERRVRRQVRRAASLLSPVVAGSEVVQAAREVGSTMRDALDVARAERRRREAELWRRIGEPRGELEAVHLVGAESEPVPQKARARDRRSGGAQARGTTRRRR